MNKKTIIDKILNESIDDKINELTSRLEEKINILEVDAYDLEYEQTYEFDSVNGKPKRVIFKGRGRKGRSDSETQTYHFEDDKGNFYDRFESMRLAIDAEQVEYDKLYNPRIGLFSEDLYLSMR